MVDYAIGKDKPLIYHLHNLLVFLLGAYLLFVFLKFYFKPILAWAGTLLYSVNLLTPHAVGWIAARGDLYLMVFGLLFLILVQKYLQSKTTQPPTPKGETKKTANLFLWLSVPVFFMALLAKESAVALIPVGLVMLYADKKKL